MREIQCSRSTPTLACSHMTLFAWIYIYSMYACVSNIIIIFINRDYIIVWLNPCLLAMHVNRKQAGVCTCIVMLQ